MRKYLSSAEGTSLGSILKLGPLLSAELSMVQFQQGRNWN